MLRLTQTRLPHLFTLCLIITLAGCTALVDEPEPVPTEDSSSQVEIPEENNITWDDCGGVIGDHPCDFTFDDQNGDAWNLYDHYGDVMLLDFSTMWCHWCKVAAGDVQSMQDTYGPSGFTWVTLLVDDIGGGEVSLEEVQEWVSEYGIITAPVLVADRSIIDVTAEDGYPVSSWPTFILIDREMNIAWGLHGWNQEMILEAIEDLLDQ